MKRRKDDPSAIQAQLTPLQYLLSIVNSDADPARRDKAAIAAAPYVHPRADSIPKKVQRQAEAKKAGGKGTEWANDLDPDGHRPQ